MEWCKISEDLKSSYVDRVRTVNNILRDLNYSWDEIEVFWQECIQEAKSKQELLTKNRTMNKRELKAKVVDLINESNGEYHDKYPDGLNFDDFPKEQQEFITKGTEKLASDLIDLITKNEK